MNQLRHIAVTATLAALCLTAQAQNRMSGIQLEPTKAKVGEPVKITVTFETADNPNCRLRVNYGDGQSKDFDVNQTKDVPVITSHSYAKAGSYKVMAEGKTGLKCLGKNQTATLAVEAAAPAAAAAPAKAAGPACPQGWKLDAKSVSKKTGAFTCTAKAGTALPSTKLACAAPLGYFENQSKGQLGCRP